MSLPFRVFATALLGGCTMLFVSAAGAGMMINTLRAALHRLWIDQRAEPSPLTQTTGVPGLRNQLGAGERRIGLDVPNHRRIRHDRAG